MIIKRANIFLGIIVLKAKSRCTKLFNWGGMDASNILIDIYDTIKNTIYLTWVDKPPIPKKCDGIAYDNQLYIIGGEKNGRAVALVY